MVLEGYFENTNENQIVSRFSNEASYCLWLQSPLNLLSEDQMTNYIVLVLLPNSRIFACLSHLVDEVRVFTIIFSLYICDLDCYCCWLKTNL